MLKTLIITHLVKFSPLKSHFSSRKSHFSPPKSHFSPHKNHFSPRKNHFSPCKNHFCSRKSHFSLSINYFSPFKNYFSKNKNNFIFRKSTSHIVTPPLFSRGGAGGEVYIKHFPKMSNQPKSFVFLRSKYIIMPFLYVLALHIIFVVTWFAGLFYIVRLYIYHAEAELLEEPSKNILQTQYKLMEKRLWYGITWPSMILAATFGLWMVWMNPSYLSQAYFILKLSFVGGLILYHFECHIMFKNLQRDVVKYSSFKLRLWNEVATVFLFSIVFLIVLKSNTGFIYGLLGLLIFSGTLVIAIKLYRKSREKKEKDVTIK